MKLAIPTRAPFSFAQTLTFVGWFAPCRDECQLAPDSLTAAVLVGDRAIAFTLSGRGGQIELACPDGVDASEVARRASDLIGASDDLAAFYAAAATDPPMHAMVEHLYGLHHVRFLTLGEVAVYCVMMQRAPITMASAMKRRFLARFGIAVPHSPLRAWPALASLAELDGAEIGEAIGNARRGDQIASVVRGVAALDEATLRHAPYAEARASLLAIPGIGPFSAAAILLRGLGRMDELPGMHHFEAPARAVYGAQFDPEAIAARYGRHLGYWAFYLKTGAAQSAAGSGRRRGPRAKIAA
ncbi:MAG: hypothetical protein WKG01_08430 [Kofleriaceae bacterium]